MLSQLPDQPETQSQRLLAALERLLRIEATELAPALDQASLILADVLGADKIDVFLYRPGDDSLVALGTSDTPMGRAEHAHDLDRLPLACGGPIAGVFRSGQPYRTGHSERDPDELMGIVATLGVRSTVVVPLAVNGERRGVLGAMSAQPERFADRDVDFLLTAARWIGMLLHRTELFERLREDAYQEGRRAAAEELIQLLTPRQREVAALVANGFTNRQIAERLVLSEGTVANHVRAILDRLGVERRGQVAARVAGSRLEARPAEPSNEALG